MTAPFVPWFLKEIQTESHYFGKSCFTVESTSAACAPPITLIPRSLQHARIQSWDLQCLLLEVKKAGNGRTPCQRTVQEAVCPRGEPRQLVGFLSGSLPFNFRKHPTGARGVAQKDANAKPRLPVDAACQGFRKESGDCCDFAVGLSSTLRTERRGAGVGPAEEEARVIGAPAHAVVPRSVAAGDDHCNLGHLGI